MGEKGIKVRDLEQLKKVLRDCPVPVEHAFLFGSRARDDYLEESDWDILIVSPEFAGIPFPERATMFLKKMPLRGVELLCYTEEEFREKVRELGIVAEAAKGKRLI